ncbi:MAG TPA: hypothetical protein VKH35_12605 [Thermoanaerobaculia bacterium]|nr:hypothetical protein [Thermoanaerobaculia bacterium]
MSYLLIVILGALVGFIAGKYLKGSEHGSAFDTVAGAVGGCLAVALSRMMSPAAALGYMTSIVVAASGAILALYGMRQVMKTKAVPAPVVRRRR